MDEQFLNSLPGGRRQSRPGPPGQAGKETGEVSPEVDALRREARLLANSRSDEVEALKNLARLLAKPGAIRSDSDRRYDAWFKHLSPSLQARFANLSPAMQQDVMGWGGFHNLSLVNRVLGFSNNLSSDPITG